MREFSKDYLFKVTVEPEKGYRSWEKRKKPYYVVASSKEEASQIITRLLRSGWCVKTTSLLAEQYSDMLFGSN